jgi:hypothetical protein
MEVLGRPLVWTLRSETDARSISPDRLGFFTALKKTYGRDTAFDIATKRNDHVLKLGAIAAADEQAAQVLLHDLATLRQKREGTPQHNAARWPRKPRPRPRAL